MKFRFKFITLGALATVAAVCANSQAAAPAAAAATAPATTPVQTTLPTPVMPSGQPQGQGLQPNQLSPNTSALNGSSAGSGVAGNVQDIAATAADQAILAQVRQTVVARVQGVSSWAPVNFQVQNGVVTVLGSLPSPALQQEVLSAVQQTPGVVNVINGTTTAGASTTRTGGVITTAGGAAGPGSAVLSSADKGLLLRIRQSVVPQIQVGGMPIPVQFNVQQGIVTLSGAVPTLAEKRQIFTLVQQVPGVVQVNDLVQVNPAASNIQGLNSAGVTTGMATGAATVPGSTTLPNNGLGNNLSPTGRSMSGGAAPPVSPRRTDLPPGSQFQAPAGISAQTNSP